MPVKTKQGPSLYRPDTLNLEQLLAGNGRDQRYIRDHVDKYAYIVHSIIEHRIFNPYRVGEVRTSGTYVDISLERLQKRIGRRYAETIVKDLLAWNVIECDNQSHYYYPNQIEWYASKGITVTSKCRGYRLTPQYLGKYRAHAITKGVFARHILSFQAMEITKAPTIYNITGRNLKAIRIHEKAALAHIEVLAEKAHSFAEAHQLTLSINVEQYRYKSALKTYKELIRELALTHSAKNNPEVTGYPLLPEAKTLTKALKSEPRVDYTLFDYIGIAIEDNKKKFVQMVGKIVLGDNKGGFFIKQPDLLSRVYTNVTSLATELRRFLFHKSSKVLVNMDIRNSQPFFFVKLLKDFFQDQELPRDVRHYIELTSTGMFYDYIVNFVDPKCVSRTEFKGSFFASIFFCEIDHTRNSKKAKLFASGASIENEVTGEITHYEGFPNVLRAIQHYKESLGSYEQLAIRMQRDEAAIMLGVVLKELHQKGIWATTIHDSVVCLPQNQATVQAVLVDAFQTNFGIVPTIKPEVIQLP